MPKTAEQLAIRALAILGKVEAGQTPNPEDVAAVEIVIEPLVAQLGLEGVTYVGDTDYIDDAVFLPLAQRLAVEVAPDFGLPASDDATKQAAEMPLRRLAASRPSGFVAKVCFY